MVFEPNFARGFENYLESGWYASAIQAIFDGKIIYKDFYFLYGPLSCYAPAALMKLLGDSLVVLRAFFLCADFFNFLFLYAICRLVLKNYWISLLAITVAVIEGHHPFWVSRWGGMRLTFAYASVAALVAGAKFKNSKWFHLAGFTAAISFLFGYDLGMLSLLTAGTFFLWESENRGERAISYAMGALTVFGIFAALLVWGGALNGFIEHFRSLGAYRIWAQEFTFGTRSRVKFFYPLFIYGFSFLMVSVKSLWTKEEHFEKKALFVLSVFGAGLYFYSFRAVQGPQFEAALPVCTIVSFIISIKSYQLLIRERQDTSLPATLGRAAVAAFAQVLGFARSAFGRTPWPLSLRMRLQRGALALLLSISFLFMIFSQKRFYQDNLSGWVHYQFHKAEWMRYPDKGFTRVDSLGLRPVNVALAPRARGLWVAEDQAQEIEQTVQFIQQNTKPGETLFTFPDLGVFNFLCNRPGVGSFTVSGAAWAKPEWQNALLSDLEKVDPQYVLKSAEVSDLALSIGRSDEVLPQVGAYLNERYTLEKKIGTILILRRK